MCSGPVRVPQDSHCILRFVSGGVRRDLDGHTNALCPAGGTRLRELKLCFGEAGRQAETSVEERFTVGSACGHESGTRAPMGSLQGRVAALADTGVAN